MWANPMFSTASAYALMAAGSFPISVCGNTTPIFMRASSFFFESLAASSSRSRAASAAARNNARRQRLDVRVDVARAREPDPIAVLENVLQRPAQPADAIRAAEDERVERDRAHERLARRLREHLVELVDDQIGELVRGVVVPDDAARVVDFDRVRHAEDPALARSDPDGL